MVAHRSSSTDPACTSDAHQAERALTITSSANRANAWQMRLKSLALVLIAGIPLTHLSAKEPVSDLRVGQVIATRPGETIDGWTHVGSGIFWHRKTADLVTTETMTCCTAVLERGRTVLIARTTPISRSKSGGVLAARIDEILKVQKQAGEESVGDCPILWITPAWTLLNERTRAARSFVVTTEGIAQISWVDDRRNCRSGE